MAAINKLLIFLLVKVAVAFEPCNPIVYTQSGQIIGTYNISRYGRSFASYRGIPYAQPPIGDLRFKEPVPVQPSSFPLDATKEGPFCIQKNYLFNTHPLVEGQEDCLYLNVYAPILDSTITFPLPVMVFIHWGALITGRGSSDILGPEYLMDKDVILVTFNYRLGPFGFLSTLDDEAPGNNGFKDQVLALKWVREHIANFGGDPNQVTIFGQSAGAGSVHLHILSEQSRGLFHRAISASGSALSLWAKPFNDLQKTVTGVQATLVGCQNSTGSSADLIKCLRNVPAETLANSQDLFKIIGFDPLVVFSSVIEEKTDRNPNPFLTKQPLQYIQDGDFSNVPWISGNVENEGILRVSSLVRQKQQRSIFNANCTSLLPQMLVLTASVADVEGELNNITQKYMQGKCFADIHDPKSIKGLIDLYTDRSFAYGSYQTAMLHSAMGHSPIWHYNFNYKGQYTFGDLFAATNETVNFDWGVSHCDELLYIFRSPALFPDITDPTDSTMIDIMTEFWTNFAITGNPMATKIFDWYPLNINSIKEMRNQNFQHLSIEGTNYENTISLRMENGFHKDRMRFWSRQSLLENFDGLN
ncbi:unnamed protein product [Brassicogethes aeneus]|uniref:Carboxylic ester hydrolase n=1 Tax=Brassicogethes aeneus TaxID=1431903 RepID=A0A9P0B6Y7_BRAAE|nr:unnamed protein product [Brassicogethes aeneus]